MYTYVCIWAHLYMCILCLFKCVFTLLISNMYSFIFLHCSLTVCLSCLICTQLHDSINRCYNVRITFVQVSIILTYKSAIFDPSPLCM